MMVEIIKVADIIKTGDRKDTMNSVDKFVNEISQNLANAILEATKYKVLYEEANEENQHVNELLSKFNSVLDSDTALKDLFDEVSQKLEEGK